MTEYEKYLIIGIEDGWIKATRKTLKEYYRLKKLEKKEKRKKSYNYIIE